MKEFTFSVLTFFTFLVHSNAQDMMNINVLNHWDNDDLPVSQTGKHFNDCWGYASSAGEYAFVGGADAIFIFDVTTQAGFALVAQIPTGDTTNWRDIKTYGDRAYAVSDVAEEGLMVMDLSQLPNSVPVTYQSTEFFTEAHNIFIDEFGLAYIVGIQEEIRDLIVLDVATNPDNPTLLANISLPPGDYIHDINVKDRIAYCSHGNNGFYIWDLNDLSNPVLLGSNVTGGYNHSSWLTEDGNTVLYAEELPQGQPLGFLDISDPSDINLINTFKMPLLAPAHDNNTPHNPFIIGDLAYVSYYEDGLQIFNIADPMNPVRAAYFDSWENSEYTGTKGNWGVYPFLPSGKIIMSDSKSGLFVLEIDQSTPTANDLVQSELVLSPNPAKNQLNVSGDFKEGAYFQVLNVHGQIMLTNQIFANRTIDISMLMDGLYFIQVGDDVWGKFLKG